MRAIVILVFSFLIPLGANAADQQLPRGTIVLLDKCPGDHLQTLSTSGNEGFFLALLTPLLTGIVNHAIKGVGTKLQEAAQEAQIDVIGTGDYFYVPDSAEPVLALKHRCVVVASKSTKQTKRTLQQLIQGYHPASIDRKNMIDSVTKWLPADPKELSGVLTKAGYSDVAKPGVLAVFDIELSTQRNAARLVPRFVVMDHSIREKSDDSRQRDITFEIVLTAPGAGSPFGKEIFKFEGLKINSARVRTASDLLSTPSASPIVLAEVGQWFGLPAIGDDIKSQITDLKAAEGVIKTESIAAAFAKAAAEKLKATGLITNCPAPSAILAPWVEANAELILERSKPEAKQQADVVARLVQVTTYYGACQRMRDAEDRRDEKEFKGGDAFVPFDIAINVKEFRDRPVAKFFGDVFADDETRKGMTTAIIDGIDPATRDAAAKKLAVDKLAAKATYETALFEAEKARVAFEGAKDEEKAAKYLEMEYRKRAANRIADDLEVARPYPDSGVWFTG